MKKITKYELNLIFDQAVQYFNNDPLHRSLGSQEARALSFLKATLMFLNQPNSVDFSELEEKYQGSVEEE